MGITAMHGIGVVGGLVVGAVGGNAWQQNREEAAAPRLAENARIIERSKPWVDSYNAFRETLADDSYVDAARKTAEYVRDHPIPGDADVTINSGGFAYVNTKSLFRTAGKEGYDLDPTAPLGNNAFGPYLPAAVGGVLGTLAFAGTMSGGSPRAAALGASLLLGAAVGMGVGAMRANVPDNGV